MITLYDIHTHSTRYSLQKNKYFVRSIVNTLPSQLEGVLGSNDKQCYCCGIHPWHTDDWEQQLSLLIKEANNSSIVAIGECGLDKIRGLSMELQVDIFKKQIEISELVGKPLIIHCVRAWDILLSIRKDIKPTQPWIVHGFRGKPSLAKQLTQSGISLSIGLLFNKESVLEIPIDKLFLETDDADVDIIDVYNKVAITLGVSIDKLAEIIQVNFRSIFG